MVGLGISAKEACKKHRQKPLYEVYVYNIENKSRFAFQCHETSQVYLTLEDAKEAARMAAGRVAWSEQCEAVDDPTYDTEQFIVIACVLAGRKVSRSGSIYGCRKIVYAISSQVKEATDRKTMDRRFNGLQIDEYTEQPVLTKDMFYQWD